MQVSVLGKCRVCSTLMIACSFARLPMREALVHGGEQRLA